LLGFLVELRHRPGESDGTSIPDSKDPDSKK